MFGQNDLKRQAAQAAIDFIVPQLQGDDVLGIGTGSTVDHFIDLLADHRHEFSAAVASSEHTARQLQAAGIQVLDLNAVMYMGFYVDGADEIDHELHMIKGGGGALTREKIVAAVADRFICIVDESKLVEQLGGFPLPLEVIPFAREFVSREVLQLGGMPRWRNDFITDNGNEILDVAGLDFTRPDELEAVLNNIPGVVCSGLFAIAGANVALVAGIDGISTLELQD